MEAAMSESEKLVRGLLDVWKDLPNHEKTEALTIGTLRALVDDLDDWRVLVYNDVEKWSFDALMKMAKLLLDAVYPETVFTGVSVGRDRIAEAISEQLARAGVAGGAGAEGIRAAADAVHALLYSNSGVRMVVLLRGVIKEIEAGR